MTRRGPRRRWTAGGWWAVVVAVLLAACGSDGETVDAPDIDESVSVRPVDEPEGDSLGLTEERILFGQSAALSGPARSWAST